MQKIYYLWIYNQEKSIPPKYLNNICRTTYLNPGYSMHIMNKTEFEAIIINTKRFYNIYNKLVTDIQKCDYSRYYLLYHYGGIYMDMDINNRQLQFNTLKVEYPEAKVFLSTECILSDDDCINVAKENEIRKGVPESNIRVSNYFIMSESKHIFWTIVFKLIKERLTPEIDKKYDIIYTTGPDIISTSYDLYKKKYPESNEVVLLSKERSNDLFTHESDGIWKSDFPK